MSAALSRWGAWSLVLCAAACTTIESPAERPGPGGSGGDGAGGQGGSLAWPYTGSCTVVRGGVLLRGATVPAYRAGAAPGSVVDYWVSLIDFPDAPNLWWRFDAFGVGWPDELRGVERPLGEGVNADLTSCVHCLVVRRDCDDAGILCQQGPYYPRSGQATIAQMADAVGGAFVMELSQVELAPVAIDADLHVTELTQYDECFYFDRVLVSGRAEADWLPCGDSYHCDLAADAGNRHPD